MGLHGQSWRLLGLMLLVPGIVLPGCAVDYVDEQGVRHIVGLASVEIPPPANAGQTCLRGSTVTAFGVVAYDHGAGGGLGVGYVSEGLTTAFECNAVFGALPEQGNVGSKPEGK